MSKTNNKTTLLVLTALVLIGFFVFFPVSPPAPQHDRYVGFRCNSEKTPEYWISVAERYSSYVPNTGKGGIWIIACSKVLNYDSQIDSHLSKLDKTDVKVYLQPGEETPGIFNPHLGTSEQLIDKMLENYGYHSCVIGVGIDLEGRGQTWDDYSAAKMGDAEATRILSKVKAFNPKFKLFLKHWLTSIMPPTVRKDIIFVTMPQGFSNFNDAISNYKSWGTYFSTANVAFQVGYMRDKSWWSQLSNPPKDVANAIFQNIPNAKGVYWVNCGGSVFEVFP